ncbi:1-acyl-sn-glycerol-3-phosphate acyltransferases [Streptomyces sp. LaPpAH-199]|uniref:lysophospholipid acyltransferase family protein n=1 Tax=Streptomyces TaxID=1883 RepID=UPI0008844B44|nr:lysophospholipid acyltransferase family protein [Streptomyces sp. LaPpAH-199]MYW80010.1 1-acyl-sn-glycerol-3-phosphate acyltransferase [Streptomyces sp. SID8369]SDD64781.1 1-acyl-sn-glycerol-3-phosphate acyltransferases [Streptomyces sp. LaPpAH-199]
MLSRIAATVVPSLGHLTVTTDHATAPAAGSIIVANHTSLVDPGVVLAALRRLGVEPVVMATAGLWRIPVLGRLLERGGHVPVHRNTDRAAGALDAAALALGAGRHLLIYGEGRLPCRTDAAEAPPESFRSGLARLAHVSGAPVVPLGQAGARRVSSGSCVKQISGFLTAPARRPRLHVHIGAPLDLPPEIGEATAAARAAVTVAWRTAAHRIGEPAASA